MEHLSGQMAQMLQLVGQLLTAMFNKEPQTDRVPPRPSFLPLASCPPSGATQVGVGTGNRPLVPQQSTSTSSDANNFKLVTGRRNNYNNKQKDSIYISQLSPINLNPNPFTSLAIPENPHESQSDNEQATDDDDDPSMDCIPDQTYPAIIVKPQDHPLQK